MATSGRRISQLAVVDILTGQEFFPVQTTAGVNLKVRVQDIASLFTKATFGLGNVNNTADSDKPISTATATALDAKANLAHTHAMSSIQGLTDALAAKTDVGHAHDLAAITGLTAALDDKAPLNHAHDVTAISGLTVALASKAALAHSHNKSDVIGLTEDLQAISILINGKADTSHAHDINSITGLNGVLANKANSMHSHNASDIGDLSVFVNTAIANAGTIASDIAFGASDW